MPTMFKHKYVYRSCCLDGNSGVPVEFVCVTVMCEGRESNPVLNIFFVQLRGGLCPNYISDSYVVQLNIKIEENAVAPKLPSVKTLRRQTVWAPKDRRQNVSAQKFLCVKTSWRNSVPTPKLQRLNVGAKTSAPKRHTPNLFSFLAPSL